MDILIMEDKKPTYKELNGATRVGDALRWLGKQGKTFAPQLLEMAGTVTGISGLNKLGNAIRKDGDLSDLDKEILLQEMEHDMVEMEEITKRLRIDSEFAITRLVRPVVYAAMFIMFLSMVFLDGNIGDFTIDKAYVPVIQSLFGTMTVFYFGSRGIEKIMKTYKDKG
jgi:hypothetical protein|tara:strand:+ start:2169 stop:2672 length:504 start_codon:yes stop_codon:yes gene_type:complete